MLTRRRLVARASSMVWFAAIAGLCAAQTPTGSPASGATLEQGFESPPDEAKPRVWWHWMNGNITKEGIKLDLEWMKRVGIGGFQNFDASLFPAGRREAPGVHDARMEGRLPVRHDAGRPARARRGDRRIARMERVRRPVGQPAQAMKKLVWSETRVQGGHAVLGHAREAADGHRPVPERAVLQLGRCDERPDGQAAARVLRGQRRRRVSRAVGRRAAGLAEADHHLERRHRQRVAVVGRRLRQVRRLAQGTRRREGVDPDSSSHSRRTIRGVSLALAGFVFPFGPPTSRARSRSQRRRPELPQGCQHSKEPGQTEHRLVPAGACPVLQGDVPDVAAGSVGTR